MSPDVPFASAFSLPGPRAPRYNHVIRTTFFLEHFAMAITVDAVYENGVLKPAAPLCLKEHQQVRITIAEAVDWVQRTRGIVPCSDPALTQWAAMDPDLADDAGEEP
jgi:predicted DNA-binding antitoxin AbrB/MazE fold protein